MIRDEVFGRETRIAAPSWAARPPRGRVL